MALPFNRIATIRKHIHPSDSRGLEIGPLNRPVVGVHEGYIRYLDHLSTADLRKKYQDDPAIAVQDIVDVHFALYDQTLQEAVGGEQFDYVIASHVIEHVPDLLGWLRAICGVLTVGGVLSLAIPDKRFTFDCTRQVTEFSDVAQAWLEKLRRPNIRQCLDHVMHARSGIDHTVIQDLHKGTVEPERQPLVHPDVINSLSETVLVEYFEKIQAGEYIDVHCSVFTPASFLTLLRQCADADLINFKIASMTDTPYGSGEFFCTLEKLPSHLSPQQRRAAIHASMGH